MNGVVATALALTHLCSVWAGPAPASLIRSTFTQDEEFSSPVLARTNGQGWIDPASEGGSMLTTFNGSDLGEPINVILSGSSDPAVLKDSLWKGGFQNYMMSAKMATECLGAHIGDPQYANLGGDSGSMPQLKELRWDYGDPLLGSCLESLLGGNHLRYWKQASTGAFFLAVSEEMDLKNHHTIVPNGYNLGRDYLVGNLTSTTVGSRSLPAGARLSGQSKWNGWTYQTDVEYVSGLLSNSSDGVNHAATVAVDGYPAIDGLVAVLTVTIKRRGLL